MNGIVFRNRSLQLTNGTPSHLLSLEFKRRNKLTKENKINLYLINQLARGITLFQKKLFLITNGVQLLKPQKLSQTMNGIL